MRRSHNSKSSKSLYQTTIPNKSPEPTSKIMSQALDLSLLKGSPEERDAVSTALLDTLKTRGVAKLKNHGVPEDLIAKMFDYVSN